MTATIGMESGNTMVKNSRKSLAPSTFAASWISHAIEEDI